MTTLEQSALRDEAYRRVRRAYELGRFRGALGFGVAIALVVGVVGWSTAGASSLPWLLWTWLGCAFAYWRGGELLRGALFGILGGLVTALLPMSLLRACCHPGVMNAANCCALPGACLASGAAVGIVLAGVVPFGKSTWWKTSAGLALGTMSVAIVKCATLFEGEAVGLAGGLLAGVVAASSAKALLRARSMA